MSPSKRRKIDDHSPIKSSPLKPSNNNNNNNNLRKIGSLKGKERAIDQTDFNSTSTIINPSTFGRAGEGEEEEGEDGEGEDIENSDDEDEEEDSSEEEEEEEEERNQQFNKKDKSKDKGLTNSQIFTKQFLTSSTGDKYLLANSTSNKTSNNLLSNYFLETFTLNSFNSLLNNFDKNYSNFISTSTTSTSTTTAIKKYESKFPKWIHELNSSFNILFYGFGSKIKILNSFAEECRKVGNVVVVNGFDTAVSLSDVIEALEGIVGTASTEEEEGDEIEEGGSPSKKRKKSTTNSKSKAKPIPFKTQVQQSAIESRTRRLCLSISQAPKSLKDLFIIIHNLDSPTLRQSKTLSLLALLASQKRIHLVASVDHLRAALLFPTEIANGRPNFTQDNNVKGKGKGKFSSTSSNSTQQEAESRAFTFVYHEITTLSPYTLELFHSPILSNLLPTSIYPKQINSLDPTSTSLQASLTYILPSVTSKSRKLFLLLSSLQLTYLSSLPSITQRSLNLLPTPGSPAPIIAIKLNFFIEKSTDLLLASNGDQVRGLLDEFKDHGVVRFSDIGPVKDKTRVGLVEEDHMTVEEEGQEEDDDEEVGGEWIWIPVGREGLEEVKRGLEN